MQAIKIMVCQMNVSQFTRNFIDVDIFDIIFSTTVEDMGHFFHKNYPSSYLQHSSGAFSPSRIFEKGVLKSDQRKISNVIWLSLSYVTRTCDFKIEIEVENAKIAQIFTMYFYYFLNISHKFF